MTFYVHIYSRNLSGILHITENIDEAKSIARQSLNKPIDGIGTINAVRVEQEDGHAVLILPESE